MYREILKILILNMIKEYQPIIFDQNLKLYNALEVGIKTKRLSSLPEAHKKGDFSNITKMCCRLYIFGLLAHFSFISGP